MKKQITCISVHSSSRLLGLLYFLITALICTPVALFSFLLTKNPDFLALLLIPFLFWVMGYACSALFAYLYNAAAKQCGGIEYFTQEVDVE